LQNYLKHNQDIIMATSKLAERLFKAGIHPMTKMSINEDFANGNKSQS